MKLLKGIFVKRYKRFFVEIISESGELITLHCPNTGSLKNCLIDSAPCWYSLSPKKTRKLPGTLELITTKFNNIANVHSASANKIVFLAIKKGVIAGLTSYDIFDKEVRFGKEGSRLDFCLGHSTLNQPKCYVEVKSATYDLGGGLVSFPDAKTDRGAKHLRELILAVEEGYRAVLFFCVQVSNAKRLKIADQIDPTYANLLFKAINLGVEVMVWNTRISSEDIQLGQEIDFEF